MRRLFEVERHALGPRLWVAGVRVHEWHLGAALLAAAVVTLDAGLGLPVTLAGLAAGAWLLIKDWNDIFPSRRDTAAWRMSVHRRPRPLRPERRADWLPALYGWAAALVGAMNIGSALTTNAHGRLQLLAAVFPEAIPRAAHAFELPAGAALLVAAVQLGKRRRRAWSLAVVVLAVAGALNLLKGLDVAEAMACWGLMAGLIAARTAFCVGPQAGAAAVARQAALAVTASLGVAAAALLAASHWARPATTPARALAEIVSRATLSAGPLQYREPFTWVPAGIDAVLVCALLGVAYLVFRPLAHPHDFPLAAARRVASALVREHGRDTLSSFKLRADQHYLFASDGQAFAGYRIEGRRLVVSGDPVGTPEAIPGLVRELFAFAEVRGLKLVAVGASADFAALGQQAGLRSFYIGDEAIVDSGSFSLEGRRIRKVRQAVARVEREGYSTEVVRTGTLTPAAIAGLEARAAEWRMEHVERGFSMATDGLGGEHLRDSLLVVARDAEGRPRGLLQFVRCYGRAAVSLGLMRRAPGTPNGLMEFMVVRAVEAMRARGIREVSLNFAPFARLIHSPANAHERLLGRLAVGADRVFQVERLYRFNAKFQPGWAPRYILYEGLLGLPMAGLSAMWAERQLPKPRLARRSA